MYIPSVDVKLTSPNDLHHRIQSSKLSFSQEKTQPFSLYSRSVSPILVIVEVKECC
jgi:hypothetical protein